jgi:hypothetical protein
LEHECKENNNLTPEERERRRRKNMILHNTPEVVMYILGSVICFYLSFWAMIVFIGYFVFSTLWYMKFVCTNCPHYDNLRCPSGYAPCAKALFKKGDVKRFHSAFKRNMGIVFPTWFAPVFVGIYLLYINFTIQMAILLAIFILDAFIILPIFSRKYGCQECDLVDECPWMGKFGK